jgi:Major Facilitator Superfamily.
MMQAHKIPIFKPWVSEWTARSVIFAILMICLFSFAYYGIPVATMGYYGIQSTDVQYAMVITYGSTVAFLALDFRIAKYFAPRQYLLLAFAVNALCSIVCFYSKDWIWFVIGQFIQGITCALLSGIVLQLIFPRLQSMRGRIIAYSLLYGCIQISAPFYSIYSSIILHYYDFNCLFYGPIMMLVLLTLLVLVTMNGNARFTKKIPLYQVDWTGYLLYVSFILILGYILVYGRQLGWFDNPYIVSLSLLNLTLLVLFIVRQLKVKRPLIKLKVFKVRNFIIGLFLLIVFYFFKGSTGLAYGYLENILGNHPLSTVPIWLAVIAGTALSMFVTSRFILMGFKLIWIILVGLGIMALYYIYMLSFISVQGTSVDFILPMFIYGIATGTLFVPIVSFTTSSVPPETAVNASLVGIFARFVGFTGSLAFNNELQLLTKSTFREKLRETLTDINPQLSLTLHDIQNQYLNAGRDQFTANDLTASYFNSFISGQVFARATQNYYDWMLLGIVCVMLIIVMSSQLWRVVIRLRKRNLPY